MSELVTPTGVLLGSPEPLSDEWFALRRGGITATDLPKILGLIPKYGSPLSVWLDKRGYDVDTAEENEAAYWGRKLEPMVADDWARRNGSEVTTVGVLANERHRWQVASLDRLVTSCPDGDGPCGLEIKTRSAYKAKLWHREVPDDTLAQVLWQMVVSGFMHMHVAVLLGGQRFRQYRVDAEGNEAIIELLVERALDVWRRVEDGEQPEVDPDEMFERMLDVLYPDREGETEVPASQVAEILAARVEYLEAKRAADKLKAAYRAAAKAALKDGKSITVEGRKVLTLTTVKKRGYTVPPSEYQTLRVVGRLPAVEDPDMDDGETEDGDDESA